MPLIKSVIAQALPARVSFRLRVERNRKILSGTHAPAAQFRDLVPEGKVAIDAGAHLGLYTFWMAQKSSVVHAFEPNPEIFRKLARSAPRNVRTYNFGLSREPWSGSLHVPDGSPGDASLNERNDRGRTYREIPVHLMALDAFGFENVGFIKVDVEGHEEELLKGSRQTLERNRPIIFIEIENRHREGAVESVAHLLQGEYGYTEISYLKAGKLKPFDSFDLERDQLQYADDPTNPEYVNNFLFKQ